MSLLIATALATRTAAFTTRLLPRTLATTTRLSGLADEFRPGDKIQIEVVSFGPLGASVEVIGRGHEEENLIPEDESALARGLILQKEIQFFRQARRGVDVVRGEVLPAYVERVREETQRLDITLREYGGKAKADQVAVQIMQRLEELGGVLPVGDKSPPEQISREFPGVSKASFKKAVAGLYRQGKVKPGPQSVTLME